MRGVLQRWCKFEYTGADQIGWLWKNLINIVKECEKGTCRTCRSFKHSILQWTECVFGPPKHSIAIMAVAIATAIMEISELKLCWVTDCYTDLIWWLLVGAIMCCHFTHGSCMSYCDDMPRFKSRFSRLRLPVLRLHLVTVFQMGLYK